MADGAELIPSREPIEVIGAGDTGPKLNQRIGKDGQLSNPEQNEIVAEAAGPSPHLLPASSKAASGTSKLSVSSS
jgi:hypothetical protein